MELEKINLITQNFFVNSKVLNINIANTGLINKTYIVEHLYNGIKSKFILQSLSDIFISHGIVNMNHNLITDHIKLKINKNFSEFYAKKWMVPSLIRCKSNNLFCFPYDSEYWRAMVFIDQAFSCESLEDERMAYQTGVGLARFHSLCSDLDSSKLEDSVSNFHDTRYYLDQYMKSLKDFNFNKLDNEVTKRIDKLIKCLAFHFKLVDSLLTSLSQELIEQNVIHGDPKLSNFLFDIKFKYVVSLVDLDTVSTGCLLTDLADCIRSICNLAGEEPKDKDDVHFDINSCKFFLKGYFSLSNVDKNKSFRFLPEFIYLIIFELSIRFLTDFLQSNRYFKIKYKTHNLYRAEVQYRLLSSLLIQMSDLSSELDKLGISPGSTFVSDIKKIL